MIDDHDRCEWVNVSSGTSSPGLPGQNPESCKTVVCVCGLCPWLSLPLVALRYIVYVWFLDVMFLHAAL